MRTIAKVGIGAAAAAVIYLATRKKKTTGQTTTTTLTPAVQAAVEASPLENKLIVQDNGNWFVVHNGKRYFTSTIKAIADFQKQYPGNETPIMNVTETQLASIPIAGNLLEGLVYEESKLSMPVGLGVTRGFCTVRNRDGSNTIYGESMISGNPCPRGGKLTTTVKTSFTGV